MTKYRIVKKFSIESDAEKFADELWKKSFSNAVFVKKEGNGFSVYEEYKPSHPFFETLLEA